MNITTMTLRKASYEGIPFEVDNASLTFGRRTVIHQFPQRDLPFVEDLGRATRQFSITGFIVGDDFIERSKRLISKIEKKTSEDRRANKGKLIHPWLGTVDVTPIDTPTVTYDKSKRICTFTLQFVEAGDETTKEYESFSTKLLKSADDLYNDIFGDYDFNKLSGIIDDVTSKINNTLTIFSESNFAKMFNMSSDILEMSHNIASTLYYKKEQARNDLLSAIGLSQYSQSVLNWKKVSYSSTEALTDSSLQPVTSASSHDSSKILSDQQRIDEVSDEIKRNIRMAMIANSMGALSMIGSDSDINEDGSDRTVSDDALIALRNNLLNAIDNEMMLQGNDSGQCYLQLVDCYTSVYNYMTAKLNGENGIDTVTLKQSEPAFVLAHDRYGDSTRADEIAQRNDVINPLFMPVGEFILSRK